MYYIQRPSLWPLYLHGPFTCMGPFASVWPFYTYIGPYTTIWGPFTPVMPPPRSGGVTGWSALRRLRVLLKGHAVLPSCNSPRKQDWIRYASLQRTQCFVFYWIIAPLVIAWFRIVTAACLVFRNLARYLETYWITSTNQARISKSTGGYFSLTHLLILFGVNS